MIIRAPQTADAETVARIYNHYVERTTITFEEEAVSAAEILHRIEAVQSTSLPWLVAERDGELVGYAYAARWHARSAYRFSVEITVYVGIDDQRLGVGSALYDRLLPMLQARGAHAVLAAIALPNEPSVALHERFGFSKVGHLAQVGFKLGRWIDVGYWQRVF